jgi:hypothetical protein
MILLRPRVHRLILFYFVSHILGCGLAAIPRDTLNWEICRVVDYLIHHTLLFLQHFIVKVLIMVVPIEGFLEDFLV